MFDSSVLYSLLFYCRASYRCLFSSPLIRPLSSLSLRARISHLTFDTTLPVLTCYPDLSPQSVLVVCHLAVLRCIFAYFMGTKLEEVPFQAFQRHVIYELKPGKTPQLSFPQVTLHCLSVFYFHFFLQRAYSINKGSCACICCTILCCSRQTPLIRALTRYNSHM
jgi:hypothetical protein